MEPLTSYVICTSPRSGSWLLADGLEHTEVAGKPREWFNEATEEGERQRRGKPSLAGDLYAHYLAWIKEAGTTANGVFGLKLLYSQFANLPRKISAISEFAETPGESILTAVFPNLKHLWLTRHDKVRQAISHYRACRSDLWWQIGDDRPSRRPGTVEAPHFDARAIAKFEQIAVYEDLAWERYFQQAGITPLVIIYEELAADYTGTIRHVLRWLGQADVETIPLSPPRLNKQADAITEEWVRRYLALGNRLHPMPGESEVAAPSAEGERRVGEDRSGRAPDHSIVAISEFNNSSPAEAAEAVTRASTLAGGQGFGRPAQLPTGSPSVDQRALTLFHEGQRDEDSAYQEQALAVQQRLGAGDEVSDPIARALRQLPTEGTVEPIPPSPERPEHPQPGVNQGEALAKQGRLDEAAAIYDQVLRHQPGLAEAYNNLGIVRLKQGNLEAALAAYSEALRLKPDLGVARANRAWVWLVQGDFARGWPEHERYCRSEDTDPRVFKQPLWQGEPLEGRTILLYAEHGLGDTLHLIRYASLVRQRGGVVLAEVQPALASLLCSCPSIDCVVQAGTALPDFDVQAPLLSLPGIFRTTLETIPADVPYLYPDADRVERWGSKLQSLKGIKVGIAWQGNPDYPEDGQRSIPLKHFAVLAALSGVRLVSLQRGYGREQLADVAKDWGVLDFMDQLDEAVGTLLDTAALIHHLDLVITSDTSIAHLAGALAMPVWVALPAACDWRWFLEREDSPWYPTMRLFRQKRWGDWNEVFDCIAQELKQHVTESVYEPLTDAGALRKRGRELCAQGRFGEAIGCLRRALQLGRESAPTYNNLGVALMRQGQLAEAVHAFQQALRQCPGYAEAHHNLGETLQQQGKLAEARISYEEALRIKPGLAAAWNSLGVARAAQGELQNACLHYQEALRLQPSLAAAQQNLSLALERLGDRREARCHSQQILGDSAAAYLRLGDERGRQGRLAEAAASYRLALRLQPESADAWTRLGQTLIQQEQLEDAVGCFEAMRRLRPEDGETLQYLADTLRRLGRLTEAESHYRRALQVQPQSAYLHNHLGITLLELGRPTEAESWFRDCISHQADQAVTHNNLGVALEQQGRLPEAIRAYQESLRLAPDCADTHKNLALARLLSGDFVSGWPEYEWRWKCAKAERRSFTRPRWDGNPLEGRTILLFAEQGLGDTLQFIRYASLVRQQGGIVLAQVQPELLPLLRRCPGIDRLLASGSPLPEYDVQAPLLSLPSLLHTTLATVPAAVPYLSADPGLVERWQEELRGLDGFKIGIAWQGSNNYTGDKHRSIPLGHFAPLARLLGVRLVSLQKGQGREQLASVVRDWNVLDLADRLDVPDGAFMDTAAVMQHLDLVVTSDTAIAHLAGALAVPVWVLLPVARDWRWLLEREDSPWYPTMRLFRQKRWGDWDEVFRRIAQAVEARQAHAALRQRLTVEISVGELLDKIAILEIKRARLTDAEQRRHVCIELGALQAARAQALREPVEMAALVQELKQINERLWEVEEELRQHEQRQDFGPSFVQLARSVYQLNDQRAQRKRRLNVSCGSLLIEEKSYAALKATEN